MPARPSPFSNFCVSRAIITVYPKLWWTVTGTGLKSAARAAPMQLTTSVCDYFSGLFISISAYHEPCKSKPKDRTPVAIAGRTAASMRPIVSLEARDVGAPTELTLRPLRCSAEAQPKQSRPALAHIKTTPAPYTPDRYPMLLTPSLPPHAKELVCPGEGAAIC